MKSEKVKQFLDYIPFLILIVEAIILIWDIITTEYLISWQHYLGLILILIVAGLFFWKHKAGVLTLVFILLLGVLGLISFDIAITTITFGKGGDFVFFHLQPIFVLWILIHVIISRRHYFGIASKKYWVDLKKELIGNNL